MTVEPEAIPSRIDSEPAIHQAPHSIEAEQAVLGGLLLSPERFDLIDGKLQPEEFFNRAYAAVFAAMCELRKHGKPIDLLMLREELEQRGQIDVVGGTAGLTALVDAIPTAAHVEYYAGIVSGRAALRRLISSCSEIIEKATALANPPEDILEHAETTIFAVTARGNAGEVESVSQVLKSTWEKIEKFQNAHGNVTGVPTGFYELDEMLTGLHEDEFIIVAGRPSMGKSTFTLNLLRHISVNEGLPAVFFTLEMSGENIVQNMLCSMAHVDAQRMRKMTLSQEDHSHLIMASDTLMQAPVWIDDTPSISLSQLRGKARRLKASHDIQIVFIDYMQLMMASSLAQRRSREQEISEISRGLKGLAKELGIPVIALSQLNRSPEGRNDKRPILSDLRESGAIEQDADVVLLLHRPEYYDRENDEVKGIAEVIVAKQRNGPTGKVELAFIGSQLRFENLSTRSDDGYVPAVSEPEDMSEQEGF